MLLAAGQPACLFGVAPQALLGDVGYPWMVGTDNALRHRHALMREARGYIATMLDLYPHLLNVAHAENTVSLRWLKHLGFTLLPPIVWQGETLRPFEMKKD